MHKHNRTTRTSVPSRSFSTTIRFIYTLSMSCHKVITGITDKGHCFYDFKCITLI